jgi:hypothetical protein
LADVRGGDIEIGDIAAIGYPVGNGRFESFRNALTTVTEKAFPPEMLGGPHNTCNSASD